VHLQQLYVTATGKRIFPTPNRSRLVFPAKKLAKPVAMADFMQDAIIRTNKNINHLKRESYE
jgi:hypothetical protein